MPRYSRYTPVRAIKVTLWGRMVGAIVPYSAGYSAFEYDPGFLSSGLDIAPLKMPLSNGNGPYVFNEFGRNAFMGLPGVFADSLPDGFGNTLINEYLRRHGVAAMDPWCGWHDFHAIRINGKQSKITDEDLLEVADRFAIGTGRRVLQEVKSAVG